MVYNNHNTAYYYLTSTEIWQGNKQGGHIQVCIKLSLTFPDTLTVNLAHSQPFLSLQLCLSWIYCTACSSTSQARSNFPHFSTIPFKFSDICMFSRSVATLDKVKLYRIKHARSWQRKRHDNKCRKHTNELAVTLHIVITSTITWTRSEVVAATVEIVAELTLVENDGVKPEIGIDRDRRIIQDRCQWVRSIWGVGLGLRLRLRTWSMQSTVNPHYSFTKTFQFQWF